MFVSLIRLAIVNPCIFHQYSVNGPTDITHLNGTVGIDVREYRYFDNKTKGLDFKGMIEDLKNATPATVSRGGVLFVNDPDIGWKPYYDSWLKKYKKSGDNYADLAF